jgi:8-oxo-dGTP diphosphatase
MNDSKLEQAISRFNLRVYGLFIDEGRILVTDEYRMGQFLTKFPGGGMHFGEGTIDCLKRECQEELGQSIRIKEHFYTTDFFQPTFFLPEIEQLISIYYLADLEDPKAVDNARKPFDFIETNERAQRFRWNNLKQLEPGHFSLPVDQHVVNLLIQKFLNH